MAKITITCTCTQSYLKFFRVMLNSIQHNCIDVDIVARLINVDERDTADILSKYNNVSIIRDTSMLSSIRNKLRNNNIPLTKMKSKFLVSELACYAIQIKYTDVVSLLSEGCPHILLLDVDSIVRKDISELSALLDKSDITVRYNDGLDKDGYYAHDWQEGVIGINNNKKTVEFFNRVQTHLADIEPTCLDAWGADGTAINKARKEMVDIDVQLLPKKYKDDTLNDASSIWSGRNSIKHDNDTFLKEMKRYS